MIARVLLSRPVILVGMMGAGKTTVGREFARRHDLSFVDCDHELETRTGVRVSTIFEVEGEAGFRRRESLLLEELCATPGLVFATGGGVVLDAANRAQLKSGAFVVYLRVPPKVLWERTRHDRNRPLLQVPHPRERIEQLYHERDPLYLEVASVVIDGGRGNPAGMVRQLEKAVNEAFKRCAH